MDLLPITGIYAALSETRAADQLTSGTYVEDGDVMIAKITPCFENGKQGILAVNAPFAYATTEVIPLRGRPGKSDSLFLHFLLLHPGLRAKLASQMDGSTNRQRLPKAVLEKVQVPVPPLEEQRQIASVLSAVQKAIELQDRLIALTTELKKGLMHMLFTGSGGLESQQQTELGAIPASWMLDHIASLGTCVTGTTPPTKVDEYYSNPAYCFVSPADLGKTKYIAECAKHVSKAGLDVARALTSDTVLCVCIGSSIGKTGMTWHKESCTNQQINAIIVDPATNAHFVYYLLTYWSEHWRNHATFGPVPIVSKGAFEKVLIPFTRQRRVQDTIAETLSAVDGKIEQHMRYRESALTLFRALLHQLMTAQLRVHDLNLSIFGEVRKEMAGAV
jgi:type I restriction enzyme S subunit